MQTLQGIEHYLCPVLGLLGHFLPWPAQPGPAQMLRGISLLATPSCPSCPLQQGGFTSHGPADHTLPCPLPTAPAGPGVPGMLPWPSTAAPRFCQAASSQAIDLHFDTATASDRAVNPQKPPSNSRETWNCLTSFCISFFCPELAVVVEVWGDTLCSIQPGRVH